MSSAIIFVTRKESEAKRLLPIVARGNGGVRAFKVESMPGAIATHAIVYSPVNSDLSEEQLARSSAVNRMVGFLTGFVSAEKASQRSIAKERRIREQHRSGRR